MTRTATPEAPPVVETTPSRLSLVLAFAAIYLIWGSTYLAIRFAVESTPPFLMAGVRFLVAGVAMIAWARWRGVALPTARQWRAAFIVGSLLMFGGNGLVTLAEEHRVSSGVAAVLVALVPLWMVVLDAVAFRRHRPNRLVWLGVAAGFAGVAVLAGPGGDSLRGVDPLGAGMLVLATLSWACGSLYARSAPLPRSMAMAAGTEMLLGGAVLLAAAFVKGEWRQVDVAGISTLSYASIVYLVIFGSIIGLSAYGWLLRVTSSAAVSTYAFVNPIVAVFLGWLFAGEILTPRVFFASSLIVGAVLLIHVSKRRPRAIRGLAATVVGPTHPAAAPVPERGSS